MSRILPTALGFTLLLFYAAFDGCSSAEQSLFAVAKEQLRQRAYAQAYATFSRFLIEHPQSASGYYNRGLAAAARSSGIKIQPLHCNS